MRVDPASNGQFILGMIGVVGGASILPIGLIVAAIGANGQYTSTDNNGVQTVHPVGSGVLPAGIAISLVAGAALVGGGIIALNNWSTGVQQSAPGAASAPVVLPRVADVGRETPKVPPVMTTPIVSFTF